MLVKLFKTFKKPSKINIVCEAFKIYGV